MDGIFLVPDESTIDAIRLLLTTLKQVTELSGACATAALFTDDFVREPKNDPPLTSIVVVICGGNIDLETLKSYV